VDQAAAGPFQYVQQAGFSQLLADFLAKIPDLSRNET
jgi:hypothetical protein